jgi:hypothetical protein
LEISRITTDEDFEPIMDKAGQKDGLPFTNDEDEGLPGVLTTKAGADIAVGTSAKVTVWTESDGKKPRSAATEIQVWGFSTGKGIKAADITAGIKDPGTAKVSFKLPKGYEVREEADDDWGTTITVSLDADQAGDNKADEKWQIRKVGTAKFDAKNPKTWIVDSKATTTEAMQLSFSYKKFVTVKADKKNDVDEESIFALDKAIIAAIAP